MKKLSPLLFPLIFLGGFLLISACSSSSSPSSFPSSAQKNTPSLSATILSANYAQKNANFSKACTIYSHILSAPPPSLPLAIYEQSLSAFLACNDIPQALKIARTFSEIHTHPLSTLTLSVNALAENQPYFHKNDLEKPYPDLLFNRITSYWNLQALPTNLDNHDILKDLSKRKFKTTSITQFEEIAITTTELFQQALIFAYQGKFIRAFEILSVVRNNISATSTPRITLLMAHAQSLAGNTDNALKLVKDSRYLNDPLLDQIAKKLENGQTLPHIFQNPRDNLAEVLLFTALVYRDHDALHSMILLSLSQHVSQHINTSLYTFERAKLFVKSNRNQDALIAIDSIPPSAPYALIAMEQKALILDNNGQQQNALKLLKFLYQKQPDNYNLLFSIADSYRRAKQFNKAISTYNNLIYTIKDNPQKKHWIYYFYRGMTFEQAGKWPDAERDMIFALSLNNNQASLLNYLGYSWIDRNINLQRGKNMLERALALSRGDYAIIDSVGWAHYQLKEYHKAVEYIEKAIQLQPLDPVINDHLGDSYWQVGRKKEAFFQWRRALQLSPDKLHLSSLLDKSVNGLPIQKKQ